MYSLRISTDEKSNFQKKIGVQFFYIIVKKKGVIFVVL